MTAPELEADDEIDTWPVRQSTIPAHMAPRIAASTPCSIFTLAAAADASEKLRKFGRFGAGIADDLPPLFPRRVDKPVVKREDGVTRCAGQRYPCNRWTEEKSEAEVARRARQKPPRHTWRSMKSKKLLGLIGPQGVWTGAKDAPSAKQTANARPSADTRLNPPAHPHQGHQ